MTKETLKLFWRATWRYKWLLIGSEIGATLFILSVEIINPFIISEIINKLTTASTTHVEFRDFKTLLLIFVAMHLVYLASTRLMMQTYIRLEPRVIRDLENLSFKKLQEHSLAFFSDQFTGALVAKVNRLTASYQRVVETTLGDFGMLMRRFVFALAIIFYLNWIIATIFLVWTIFFCISLVYLHKRKLRYSRAAAAAQTRVTARLADIITNTLTIRSFSRNQEETREFKKLSQERADLRFRSHQVSEYIRIYKGIVIIALQIVVLFLSVQFGLNGTLQVGSIVLIQFYLFSLIAQLWNFGRFMDRVEESLAEATEMTEIIMLPHDVIDPENPEKSRIKDGAIDLRQVSFQYNDGKKDLTLFKNLTVTIPAGQKVGLVGPSGGGKTTFTKLLLRFMDIDAGSISIDGQDIAKLAQEDLRESIAYVPQEPLLFHRSLLENIGYGNPKASKRDVIEAAKKARADDFIKDLPDGYATTVGERGVKLSGGQRQRVAIARAFLKNAPILVLDEATSSLDSVSEKLITSALDTLMAKRTTIVIAHRLSTIRKLDRILVMDDGKIVEDGSHDQLLKKKGLYAQLWAHQSGDFIGSK